MIFWLVLKLEISLQSYNILKGFGFFLEDFLKIIIFKHGEIFEFFHHNSSSSSFALRYFYIFF
jgi:hypothetical protein